MRILLPLLSRRLFCFVLFNPQILKARRWSRYSCSCYFQTINSPFLQKPLFLWDPRHPTTPSSPSPFLLPTNLSLVILLPHWRPELLAHSLSHPNSCHHSWQFHLKEQSVQYASVSIPRPHHPQCLFIHHLKSLIVVGTPEICTNSKISS